MDDYSDPPMLREIDLRSSGYNQFSQSSSSTAFFNDKAAALQVIQMFHNYLFQYPKCIELNGVNLFTPNALRQAEVDRLKLKLNQVISTAEYTLQEAREQHVI